MLPVAPADAASSVRGGHAFSSSFDLIMLVTVHLYLKTVPYIMGLSRVYMQMEGVWRCVIEPECDVLVLSRGWRRREPLFVTAGTSAAAYQFFYYVSARLLLLLLW